jgi:hypothetical protein
MDTTTKNIFAPTQQYPQQVSSGTGNTVVQQYAYPVEVVGTNNVFFGPRLSLPTQPTTLTTKQPFKVQDVTYVGVNGTDEPVEGAAARFQTTGQRDSVLIGNNFQLPPVGTQNVVIGNDICWDFRDTDTKNVLIAPFTPRTLTGTNTPQKTATTASNWVVIGYPDVTLMESSGVLINCAAPQGSSVVTTGNVIMNLAKVPTAAETTAGTENFMKYGVPLYGLYTNAETNELRIRLPPP